ncbi:MAG: RluA family pseudouridine synthase [Salaquimonas sp.]|jgi:23S rRNA pseudouridine1911/1915/1917 synthase|nr:RluA family pseudouridine synthase [Salaquimonas sp.]
MSPSPEEIEGEDRASRFTVDAADAGARLDAWLAALMPAHVSRSRVKALILEGHVTLNGKACTSPNQRLKPGDEFALLIPEPEDATPLPEAIPLDILYEDDDLIVVHKPAGMVVHPAPGNATGTLVNALLYHCGESLAGIGGVRRPGIVHRLDKDTSGVMVVAKTERAHAGLAAQFADHGRSGPLERFYLALVWGGLPRAAGTIDAPLGRSPNDRLKRAVVSERASGSRHAVTHYRVLRKYPDRKDASPVIASLVECRLETGRTHQIRVHMAHIGHPLIGDRDYGAHFATKVNALPEAIREGVTAFHRQALHAATLSFAHPATGETMRFEASLPEDFSRLLHLFETAVQGSPRQH